MVVLAHVPTRTCVGCRARSSRTALIRLACDTDQNDTVQNDTGQRTVVVDRFRRLPGRGAWVHPDEACIRSALSPGRLHRALRGPVSVGGDILREALGAAAVEGFAGDDTLGSQPRVHH